MPHPHALWLPGHHPSHPSKDPPEVRAIQEQVGFRLLLQDYGWQLVLLVNSCTLDVLKYCEHHP